MDAWLLGERGGNHQLLDVTSSLRENLSYKTIIEFPTLYIVTKGLQPPKIKPVMLWGETVSFGNGFEKKPCNPLKKDDGNSTLRQDCNRENSTPFSLNTVQEARRDGGSMDYDEESSTPLELNNVQEARGLLSDGEIGKMKACSDLSDMEEGEILEGNSVVSNLTPLELIATMYSESEESPIE